jgi:general secretion pathway protein G
MNAHRPQAAFTLIEIMLVVVIIGVLATIAIVKVGNKITDARINATKVTVASIRSAIGQYELEKGKYPDSLADLVSGTKHYLDQEKVPADAWGHEFRYYLKADLVKIRSSGPDATFDTEDDIENQ